MKLTAGMLREIIEEEVVRARRARLREAGHELSIIGNVDDVGDLSFPDGPEAVVEAEEWLKEIFETKGSRFADMWAELWNVLCDDISQGVEIDLKGAALAAGFPSDGFSWIDDVKELANMIFTVPQMERWQLRDGFELLDEWRGS